MVVEDNRTGRVSYWQAEDHQSVADRNGVSLAEYIHVLFGLIRQRRSRDVLMIGCAGGTLATMLSAVGVAVTAVDIDPQAFDIAHRYFHMPETVECHVADGAAFLKRGGPQYDAIVLDAFTDELIPSHLLKPSFFRLVKARLRRGGIFLVNIVVLDDDDPTPDQIARIMRQVWRRVRLLDADGFVDRNAVAMAGAVQGLRRPHLIMKPAVGARTLAEELRQLRFRRLR